MATNKEPTTKVGGSLMKLSPINFNKPSEPSPQQILSDITVHMKYAKYLPEKERRETWEELVERSKQGMLKKYANTPKEFKKEIINAFDNFVLPKKVLTSMRFSQFAGNAVEKNNARIYNCSYLPLDHIRAFSEAMFLSLGGSGVGFSVQQHHIDKLPPIIGPDPNKKPKKFLVGDSIEGWADAVKALVNTYFKGRQDIVFDLSDIREKGARLVTAGGKAPGPEPLRVCLENIRSILEYALSQRGKMTKIRSIEAHDMMMHIADAVYAGGIRRSAMISGFSYGDDIMLNAKSNIPISSYEQHIEEFRGENGEILKRAVEINSKGNKFYNLNVKFSDPSYPKTEEEIKTLYWVQEEHLEQLKTEGTLPWFYFHPHRGRANNSIVLMRDKITKKMFDGIWEIIVKNKSGEPGFYFTNDKDYFTNPCAEISLRPNSFCNLTEINASNIKTQEDFNERARVASFLGTLQAGFTDLHYLRTVWQDNLEKEYLIGVGITGIANKDFLSLNFADATKNVLEENERVANIVGIKKAYRTTCVKPSGTTSSVIGCSSGVHAWHNDHYIRRIRVGKNEAIYTYLSENHPELIEDDYFSPETNAVISVPQKAPDASITREESVFDLLERTKRLNQEWIKPGHRRGPNTHNTSCTISVKDEDWQGVGEWMWENRFNYNGIAVLPYDGGTYIQAPFEDITEEQYTEMVQHLNKVDLTKVIETEDNTDLSGELACAGGACTI